MVADTVQQTVYPVTFTLDAAPPIVTLATNLLGLADTWALGSDMLRFNGTASDNMGLAAVQIKIGDAPFVEAGFDEISGEWKTAQLVADPEGKALAVTVQAIDRAGRITDVSGTIRGGFHDDQPAGYHHCGATKRPQRKQQCLLQLCWDRWRSE